MTAPSLQHPLMGARLGLLVRALVTNGGVDPRHSGIVAAMALSAAARTPFRWLDEAIYAQAARRSPPREAPLIIIGHWRTGTTHLHNLMGQSPAYGIITPIATGLPDQLLSLGTALRPLLEQALPADRHVDRVAVTPASPQEDEIPLANQQSLSIFHAVYFPQHFQAHIDRGVFWDGVPRAAIDRWARMTRRFVDKVAIHQGQPRIVLKNPVYTGRLRRLIEIWPEARFIHIRRNPFEVFASTCRYYRRLLPELALQRVPGIDIEAFVLATFERLMGLYEAERQGLPANRLVEISYEQLARHPLATLEQIHGTLDLPGWRQAAPRIEAYLESIHDYRPNAHELTGPQRHQVKTRWEDAIARWAALPG